MASRISGTSYTRALAELAAGVDCARLPADLQHEAGRVLLDCIGCVAAGQSTPLGSIALDLARGERGPLEATAIGVGRVSLLPAVFANATLANALEYEVQGPEGHIPAVAAPVALAVAEALDASGSELVAGLIAGLEVAGRIGGGLRGPARSAGAAGGHAHVVFAAAAAAGRILGLSADQMAHALGIAGYGATVRTTERYQGSHQALMIKNSLGVMAQAGTQAALLAGRGFTGDLDVLEGDLGFWRFIGSTGCDWEHLTRDLGTHWVSSYVSYKPSPSALNMVSTVQLLERMVAEHNLLAGEIERVVIRSDRRPERPWPAGGMNPTNFWRHQRYVFSAALAGVRPYRSWPDPNTYQRPDVLTLMDRLELERLGGGEIATPEAAYEEGWSPVRVSIRARGRTFEGAQDYRVVMSDDQVASKFRENVSGLLADADAARIEQAIANLPARAGVRDLLPRA